MFQCIVAGVVEEGANGPCAQFECDSVAALQGSVDRA